MSKIPKTSFTQQEYEKASRINILDFLEQNGYEIEKSGREWQLKEHDSLKFRDDNRWYWHSRQVGGNSCITFVKALENLSTVEAVKRLYSGSILLNTLENGNISNFMLKDKKNDKNKAFLLPPPSLNKNGKMDFKRIYAYLNKSRYIDIEIITKLIHDKKLYQSKVGKNVVFVFFDEKQNPVGASQRGTLTDVKFHKDVENSNMNYPFVIDGTGDTVYVFESPIDAMSHATLCNIFQHKWNKHHRISLNGLSEKPLETYLKIHHNIKNLIFCLDNDANGKAIDGTSKNHGQIQAQKLFDKYKSKGFFCAIETPINKDFNDDLRCYVDYYSYIEENENRRNMEAVVGVDEDTGNKEDEEDKEDEEFEQNL